MLQQGIHPKVVQERPGHGDIALTLNTYSHVRPSMQEDAAGKLKEILTPIDVTDNLLTAQNYNQDVQPDGYTQDSGLFRLQ